MVRLFWSRRALHAVTLGFVAMAWNPPAVHAQSASLSDAQAPAHISFVEGSAVLERDGVADKSPGSMPLLAGDRVRTQNGRVEILFTDGSTLHLDNYSAIDLQSDDLVRLVDGRIRLSIPGSSRAVSYRIDGPQGWAHISEPGDYRMALAQSAGGGELEFAVMRGGAELANEGGRTPLRAGERAFVRAGAAPSEAYVANSSALDAFDRWSEARRDQRMAASTQYLPEEVRPYAASFEQYGSWSNEPTYGYVWYPRVAVGWRPYYHGRWVGLKPYGWTWIASDPWGWPTHHYGRWGISPAGAWFWIPGRTWGAAWVSWAYAPGYVSWCPLGWNNRPVYYFNVHARYDPWRAWTVVPRHRFGYGIVGHSVVRATHIDRRTLSAFASGDRAPEFRGSTGARPSTPIRLAGTGSIRSGSPLYTNRPVDQTRIRTDGARVRIPDGARPSSDAGVAAVPRERAVPSRPAVRSDRSMPSYGDSGRAAVPDNDGRPALSDRRGTPTGSRPRADAADAPRRNIQEVGPAQAVPRYGSVPDRRSPAPGETPGATRRSDAPSYERPSGVQPRVPYAGTDRRSPAYDPGPRAVPRADAPSPGAAGGARAPQAERRGPDRGPAGSIQSAPSRPSGPGQPAAQPSGGGRASAPPAGARPRGGGRGGR